jgi:S-adenosylmethionine decarboxylase
MIGRHLMADFYGVAAGPLRDGGLLCRCLLDAAARVGLTPVAPPAVHVFPGGGLTAFLLLAESHIALHTYPERGFLALDLFTCGTGDPHAALEAFREALRPEGMSLTTTRRGVELE